MPRLLFVSRVVAHKGHKHAIALGEYLRQAHGIEIAIDFAGREDPAATEFNESLRTMAKEAGISVTFYGELPEEDLERLYASTDAFLCLSEHEGFGLPVFEAMRVGVPVIALARTAFAELLAHHPLCSQDLDNHFFAAGLLALRDDSFRQQIILLQDKLVASYTENSVRTQIAAALNPTPTTPLTPESIPDLRPDSPYAAMSEAITKAAQQLRDVENKAPRFLPHDVGPNFVTLHDLDSYGAMIQPGGFSSLTAPDEDGSFEYADFPADRFLTIGGVHQQRGIRFAARTSRRGHAIFGPYAVLPVGIYEVEFAVDIAHLTSGRGRLMFDVRSERRGTISRRSVSLGPRSSRLRCALSFSINDPLDNLEFRIACKGTADFSALFRGARVKRLQHSKHRSIIGLIWPGARP